MEWIGEFHFIDPHSTFPFILLPNLKPTANLFSSHPILYLFLFIDLFIYFYLLWWGGEGCAVPIENLRDFKCERSREEEEEEQQQQKTHNNTEVFKAGEGCRFSGFPPNNSATESTSYYLWIFLFWVIQFIKAEIRFKARGEQNIILGKRQDGESSSHHNSLWMAHWTSHTQNKQGLISLTENTKTRVAEQLVIGMNCSTTTNSNLLGTRTNENFDFYFNSLTQKGTVSSKLEASEVLEGSDHFPMYGIKKKIESILNPKGKARLEDNIAGLNFTFHSSEEFHFESVEQNPKNHQPALESCSCTEEGNNLSTSSQIKCPSHSNRTQSMDSADSLRGSSKRKAVSLFEMVSLPTESHDIAQSKRKSKSCENYKLHGMIDKFRKSEGPFEPSDAKDREAFEELASSRAQKVRTCHVAAGINSVATVSPEKPSFRDQNIGFLNINQDPGPSCTVTMDVAESLLKSSSKQKADSISMEKQQKPSDQEGHDNRWLKRLKHDVSSNTLMMNPRQLNYENSNPSWISEQQMKSWIKRWCVKKLPSEEGENSGVAQEELQERQFPSIHAMAMMGKAMNTIRPGEFEKRGPSVVWNNNEC